MDAKQEHQAVEVPLSEQWRVIPPAHRIVFPIQWASDGTETGHQFVPVGYMAHRTADILDSQQAELERLRPLAAVLQHYVGAYPAFRMKPIGAEGSPARIEQENLMALEEQARAALVAAQGGAK